MSTARLAGRLQLNVLSPSQAQHSRAQSILLAESRGALLQVLGQLPMDRPALQSCTLGKVLTKLKNSGPQELRQTSGDLVKTWKTQLAAQYAPQCMWST